MLTHTQVAKAKKSEKTYKLTDGGGLYLEVSRAGGRYWRYRFRLNGKETIYTVGEYPMVSLLEAREKHQAARKLVKAGMNPTRQREAELAVRRYENANTFEAVADEWVKEKAALWSAGYRKHVTVILKNDINRYIGMLPIKDIKTPVIYDLVRRIEKRGAPTRAILARQLIGSVFNLAILTHRAEFNIADPLKGKIARRVVEHHKRLREEQLPDFLRKLEDYSGHRTTQIALKLLLLTAVRPGELCGATWAEFNLDGAEWRIPAERMKMRTLHIVPLPSQAVELLKDLQELTGMDSQLFPSQGTKSKTIPVATLRNAIAKMGYSDRFSPHGARGTFSTMCNEAGFRSDVIERQLAHKERNAVRASYNQAEYLPERRLMMQQWADTLESLRDGRHVTPFRKAA